LDAESGVLLWNNIVLIVRVKRLVLRWHIDVFMREMGAIEVLQKIGMVAAMQMDVGV
jgi:hypothetical protein